ncbi:hypothetical protein K6U45_01220 [Vibrio vulnificus]|uniref:hypothetical protein n=1 Tax=Vibrio vulnificus TaxID=672 RepID=UPI001EEC5A48|nr:hypothetical protein [Vibrio vulnificus]MCG6298503.1 hypothetical protein [Vibrio vulnificus]
MTKIRKEKPELSSAAKKKKLSTPPPRPQLSFPSIRGSMHPHLPEAAFGNPLTAPDKHQSETNNTANEAIKTSHGARYTMGPRFREDDEVRELIRTTNNTGNEALKPSHGARYTMGPRVCEDDGVREWIRTTSNTNNKALKPSYSARYTMGPRVREDDLVIESMVNLLSLTHATANAKDNSCANKDSNIEASLDDCLISPFLITPSIVPLNTIFY